MSRPCLLLLLVGVGASVTGQTRPALATSALGADVLALSAARASRGRVLQLKPRLLERGERLPLALPAELLDPKDPSCTTVAVLGVEELHFVLRFAELDPGAPSSAFPESSAAGAIEVTRCGAGKPFLAGLSLELRSPRGVIETLVSNAPGAVPPLFEVLPQRNPGSELPLGDPGPRPGLAPLTERLLRLEARAQRARASSFERDEWHAHEDGTGGATLPLKAGCHELTLLDATPPTPSLPPVDLDLELVDEEGGAPLAVDRAEDADATASICLGAPANVELHFAGATPNARVLLRHARWELPAGIPPSWGPEARGRLASLAQSAHFSPEKPPIYQSIGVQGTTALALELLPNTCYTILLAPLRGEVQSLSLSALARAPGQAARGTTDASGSALSFCAAGAPVATLEIDGRGTSLAWILAAWETGRTMPGSGTP